MKIGVYAPAPRSKLRELEPHLQNLDRMLATWNASDESEVRTLAEAALEHNIHFVDTNHNITGREAFISMGHAVKKENPRRRLFEISRVDVQNNHCRYHWAIHLKQNLLMLDSTLRRSMTPGRSLKS